ncbi:hypothetical protein BCR44DRAFT_212027 [Catenaria anguillulae PL171]|uniref:Uncharacterized protein n=1 Tax=Catenaria anguillulae PL171 TaxID=765915 RepID=A0A1Y2GX30_9FUNG|nr:hypothetical protein BCR44DRAFT_212027 [Catenaria anguillulae PL171]
MGQSQTHKIKLHSANIIGKPSPLLYSGKLQEELAPDHGISAARWAESRKKVDEFYLDEIMRWVPISSSRIAIQIDPVNNDCGKCHAWAEELADMYTGHAEVALGILADKWENPQEWRRKWQRPYLEVEIPSRSDGEGGPLTYLRVPEGKELSEIVRQESMFWSGWYMNEIGIHVKAQDGGIHLGEGLVAARVHFASWSALEDDDDRHWFMLNQYDVQELNDPVIRKHWLIHLPTGAACEQEEGGDRNTSDAKAMATLFKLVRHIENKRRVIEPQQAHHSPIVSRIRFPSGSRSLGQEHNDEVARIYTPSHVLDCRSGLHFTNSKAILQGQQECHNMLKALLEYNAAGSIQRVIRSLVAVVEADDRMNCVQ